MPGPSARLLLIALALLLAGCNGCGGASDDGAVQTVALEAPAGAEAYVPVLDGPLRVLSATPAGPMEALAPGQAVTVTFSRPMVPLGEAPALPGGAFALDPAVPGALRWEGTQTLMFQPDEPLPPATAFTARVAAGLEALGGERLAEAYTWTFETPRPALVETEPSRNARYAGPKQTIRLAFNQPIQTDAAERFVSLHEMEGGQPSAVAATLTAEADSILILQPADSLQKGARYEVRLAEGLPSAGGPLGLRPADTLRFQTYPPPRLAEVTQPRSYYDDPQATSFDPERGVTLVFSTPVRFESLRKAASFEPSIELPPGIEARDNAVSESHTLPLDLAPETRYTVVVRNLRDQFGQHLDSARATFRTRAYTPSVRMKSGLLVIEAEQQAAVPVRATNVEAVRLGAKRLAADEVVPHVRVYDRRRYYPGGAEGEENAPEPVEAARRFPLGLTRNAPGVVPLRLDSLLENGTGVVGLRVVKPKGQGVEETEERALAQVTRLGLTAKFSPHQNLVFVTDLETARPVPDAQITLRDARNAIRWRGATDAEGRAAMPGWAALGIAQEDAWRAPVQYVFAEKAGDLAFTSSLYDEGLEPWRFDVDYAWRPEPTILAGSVFTDRGLYRVGEAVHLKTILRRRTDADWQSVTDSVRVLIQSPREETVFDRRFFPSDLGTFHFRWDTPASADQGMYRVRVGFARDTAFAERSPYEPGDIAEGSFRVDAFRRATFAVTPRTAREAYVAGDFFEGSIEGRYLFGAAMQRQPVTYHLQRTDGSFTPPGYDAYRFGTFGNGSLRETLARSDTVLSEEGTVEARVQLPGNAAGAAAEIVWSGTVTDPARQEISARRAATLHPGLFYIGLKPQTTFLDLSEDDALSVDVITVDPNGQPVAAEGLTLDLVREQWNSVREVGADGRLRWRSERTEEAVATRTLATERGKASRLQIPIEKGGRYVLRATGRDVRGNTIRTEAYFYATGGGYVAWQRADDDRVELVPERETYRPGETARLMVQSPYEEATALITVEREGILSSRVTTLTGSAPQIEVPLSEEHLPNAFVSVILLNGRSAAPDAASDVGAPGFKIGYATLRVDAGVRHLQVEVVPEKETYRPGEEVEVALRLRDQNGRGVAGEIAFSAADAGVLNLIGYALPDPFEAFYGPRPLQVTTSETRANLIEQRSFGQKEEDLGGGGGGGPDLMLRQDFRPLAHWAPAVRTDARGRATVTFRVPESLTTFRLMAAALSAEGHLFGQGAADIVVTKPLVMQPALPRFARLNDEFEAGVLVTNTTGADGEVTVRAQGEDGVALSGASTKTIELADGETREVRFAWTAERADTARVEFEARLGNERDALATALPVKRPLAKEATATFASTTGLAEEALRLPEERVPGLGRFRVQMASTALVGLEGAVEYLFDYPYGCIEQRTSRIRPLLLADDVLDAFALDALENADRKALVADWTRRLSQFWTGGGFAMWEGGRQPNPYVSAYVVLALAEAESAGYAIPTDLTRQAVDALERDVRQKSERPAYYDASVWADTRALMLYALARHGRVLETEITTLAEEADVLSVAGVSHLLRAVVRADRTALNDWRGALAERLKRRIRTEATTAHLSAPASEGYGWIFASDTRATAFGLVALIEAENGSQDLQPLAERMVRYLMQARQGGHWASTQENAATVDAFRAYFEAYEEAAPDFAAEVLVAGRRVLDAAFRGRSLAVEEETLAPDALPQGRAASVEISKRGTGTAYYSLLLETYSAAPQEALAQGLSIERRVQRLDDRGEPEGEALVTGAGPITLDAGALVRVTLRLTSPTDRHYVVVDDALPAGLEALNAAFETTDRETIRNADAGQDRWWGSFNHTEIRDDRVLLFADELRRGEHTYTYVARATTPGTFVHPPAEAEMMYQPSTRGRTATGTLVVEPAPGSTAGR